MAVLCSPLSVCCGNVWRSRVYSCSEGAIRRLFEAGDRSILAWCRVFLRRRCTNGQGGTLRSSFLAGLDYVHLSYTLNGRQGRPHKTVRIECVLAFIDIRSTR